MRAASGLSLPILVGLFAAPPASSYSVLTHEAIIDASWPGAIRPLLVKRFPAATEEQLRNAHAYAYGGAIIQDMGYYPFGSKFFSDLTHYVRSGDFVVALIRESQDINEYAFALGSLAHYASDNEGHPVAINRAVPLLYPKLRTQYGENVTYEDDPPAHLKFVYRLSRASYHKEWDRKYDRPGPGARFLAWLFHILPKIGPLKALGFKVPTPEAEKLFLTSFAGTSQRYRSLLAEVGENRLQLPNENFDIGQPTRRGVYTMADQTYDKLLEQFRDAPDRISSELRADILRFFGDSGAPASEDAQATLSALRKR